ncbi:MAG: FAD-dependent oxidoreductase [Pseudomonadota bacterium]|nr:FAD-dependent oxidoreductase [Pseudomonadota bacterium]
METAVEKFAKRLEASDLVLESIADLGILHEAVGVEGPHPKQVIRPTTSDELAIILPAAADSGVTLWTAWNQSGNALVVPAGDAGVPVLLELSGMNRILEVDAASGYALVEPGVSHAQLASHLEANELKLWTDVGADADASIVGGIWERSFGYTAYGDRMMMQCGMEVMQTDGSLVRTGMGAMPGENSWQLFKYGFGPYADGIFTQSSYTVMTKVGFWVSPEPPAYRPFAWRIDSDDVFIRAMEAVRSLRINMVVPNTLVAVDSQSEQALTKDSTASAWNIYGALYGLPKNVDVVWKMIEGLASQLGGVIMEPLNDNPVSERAALMSGRPSIGYKSFLDDAKGRLLRLSFVMPIEGDIALEFVQRTYQASIGSGCRVVVEQGTAWRSLLAEVYILFDEGDIDSALKLGQGLIKDWAKRGVGVVRASPALQPVALEQYSNTGFIKLHSHLEEALA